jgi:hypothetical protein
MPVRLSRGGVLTFTDIVPVEGTTARDLVTEITAPGGALENMPTHAIGVKRVFLDGDGRIIEAQTFDVFTDGPIDPLGNYIIAAPALQPPPGESSRGVRWGRTSSVVPGASLRRGVV